MNNDATRIQAFTFDYGAAFRVQEAVYKLEPPAILFVPLQIQGVNRDGATMWLHKFDAYIRMGNMAGNANPIGYMELFGLICNKPVSSPPSPTVGQNILHYRIYKNSLTGEDGTEVMDTPTYDHKVDPDGMDFFVIHFVLPELGDQLE